MNSSAILPLLFLLSFRITAACLLNDTHCTCTSTPPGGTCLRYVSTSADTNYCSTYTCHAGTVCDCMGSHLCQITKCPASRRIFRPLPGVHVNTHGLSPCKLASDAICINPLRDEYGEAIAAPSPEFLPFPSTSVLPNPPPSHSPTASASMAPTPAPSMSPTSSPSESLTPTPSASMTSSPSVSMTPSPSVSMTPSRSASMTPTPSPSLSATPSVSSSSSPSITPSSSSTPSVSITPSPSLSATASPSMSATPTPSASQTPTPTPSVTLTPSPSTKPTPSPASTQSPIPSPSPSATPSLVPLPIGTYCKRGLTPCEQGAICSCKGICSPIVKMDVAALSDNTALISVCDKQIGKTDGWKNIARFSYFGACDDIIVENMNTRGQHARIAVAIEHESQIYSTGFGMDALVKKDPRPGYLTNPFYDYSKWISPVSNSVSFTDEETKALNEMQDEYAALPIGPAEGQHPAGVYTYKLTMPFCQDHHSDITQF